MLTSRQPIWIGWGKDLIKLYNDPYKAIVGGKHPWALGSPASVVWKDIWRDIEPMLRQVMEKDEGTYSESQLLIMERNGYPEETYYTFSYTPIPGDEGGTAGMICANTDDTDRIISERQLRTLTQLGKSLTDSKTTEEVIHRTINTLKQNPFDFPFALFRTIFGNKATLAYSTHSGPDFDAVPNIVDLGSDTHVAEVINKTIATRKLQVLDNLIRKVGELPKGAWEKAPDKSIVLPIVQPGVKELYGILVVGHNPYRPLDEKYASFFTLVADLVATSFADVQSHEQERKRIEALAEIDRAKTTFFSNISHEFRTPLTLLIGPIEEMMNDGETDPATKTKIELAYRNTLRMQKLVNTLLDFSKIEAGRMEGRFHKVDIIAFTRDLASTFRSAVEKAGMQLEFHGERLQDEIYVDPDMWEKIVLNLISNAFKYSNDGAIIVKIEKNNGYVHFSVTDTGVGIPKDQLDKIFDRFYRVENIQGRSQEGTGIGLSMVKELVKMHNGTINVTSIVGKGSTFIITMPPGKDHLPPDKIVDATYIATASQQSVAYVQEAMKWIPQEETILDDATAIIKERVEDNGKHTVLLADDNTDMRVYVQRLLSEQFNVIPAIDGEDAYAKMLRHKPDLLLTDVMMPKLDGVGLLKKVRSHPETKNIPVIFLSALAGEEAKVEGLDAGADDYLIKPFYAKELLARVDANIKIAQNRIAAENNLRNIIRQSPVGMILLRGDTLVVELINEEGLRQSGRRHEDIIGFPALEAFPEMGPLGMYKQLEDTRASGNPFAGNEMPLLLSRDNEEKPYYFNITFQPLKNTNGDVEGVIIASLDVTEQVEARKKVEQSEKQYKELTERLEVIVDERTEALRRSNDDLQQFAHVASHDLKEPVRKMKTFLSRLEDEYGDLLPEKGKGYVNKMINASERMDAMIEGVLRYSSLSEGDQAIQDVDLNEIIQHIEVDLEVVIHQKNALINKAQLPTLKGAPVLVYQLFYNLIYNSLKFTRDNVQPIIGISSSVVSKDGSACIEISITDNGIGFDKEYSDRIFDTFIRLNSKDKYEGTGLGLALCKKIVERHHGEITASGTKGKGATFTVVLPLTQTEQSI
jgi:signal transduction histidine kinase/ActR/RegA family two-component response regulator